jgi:hypothetical protein
MTVSKFPSTIPSLGLNIMTVRSTGFVADMRGLIPESWACIDCGINTAPGLLNRVQAEQAFAADWENKGIKQTVDDLSEVYVVKPAVWRAAGMEGGCLCIGCLETRIGRTLVPKDFKRNHPFHSLPGTKRLLARRDRLAPPRNLPGAAMSARAVVP